MLGEIELTKLAPLQVQHMVRVKAESGLKPKTVKGIRDTLRAALNVAMEANLITRNVAGLTRIHIPEREPTVWDQAQGRQFLAAIAGHRWESLYWLALCMGPREGENLGVKWDDLNFETRELQVSRSLQRIPGERKGEKTNLALGPLKTRISRRRFWIPAIIIEKLLEHRRQQEVDKKASGAEWVENGLVFTTNKGMPIDPRNLQRDFHQRCCKAGLPRIRFHDLRHSAATIMMRVACATWISSTSWDTPLRKRPGRSTYTRRPRPPRKPPTRCRKFTAP